MPNLWISPAAWVVVILVSVQIACTDLVAEPPRYGTPDELMYRLEVRRGRFEDRVLLTGTLEATRGVRLTPPRTPMWQVQIRWLEEDGASVKAGQKVVELDNTSFVTDLEQMQLTASKEEKELQQQRAQAMAREAELGFAVTERRVELEKAELEADVPEELLPRREYQEKQLAVERARTALSKAEEELSTHRRTSEQELAIKELALEKTRYDIRFAERAISQLALEAPRDGVLILGNANRESRKLQPGDTVWPGFAVAQIPDLENMQVEATLSDVDDGRLRVGFPAEIRLDSYPEIVFQGVVRDITPVAQETSPQSLRRAFRVRVELAQSDPAKMRPGMAARVDVHPTPLDDVLLVPRAAVDFSSSPPRALLPGSASVEVALGTCNAFECVCLPACALEDGDVLRARTHP